MSAIRLRLAVCTDFDGDALHYSVQSGAPPDLLNADRLAAAGIKSPAGLPG